MADLFSENTLKTRPRRAASPLAVAFAGLTALAVAMGIGRFAFTPILPMMQQDAALSLAGGSWLASANYLGFMLGAVSAIRLKVRHTIVIRWGLVMIGVLTLGMGFTSQFAFWMVLRRWQEERTPGPKCLPLLGAWKNSPPFSAPC